MATNLQLCDIDSEVEEKLNKFKFRKETNTAAIVLKIDREKQQVVLDEDFKEYMEEVTDIEELANELPASQPRYVLLSFRHKHSDKRVSYPFCFIFVSPQGCQPELTMLYAGTKLAVVNCAKATKVFEIRSTDELTEDYLKERIAFFK